jgi:oleate hydratase
MPFITSQFLRRTKGDCPLVRAAHSKNLAFVGQFCELPDDVVFTLEHSIRSAQLAVHSLLGLERTPPPVYQGKNDGRVLLKAFLTLHGLPAHAQKRSKFSHSSLGSCPITDSFVPGTVS